MFYLSNKRDYKNKIKYSIFPSKLNRRYKYFMHISKPNNCPLINLLVILTRIYRVDFILQKFVYYIRIKNMSASDIRKYL